MVDFVKRPFRVAAIALVASGILAARANALSQAVLPTATNGTTSNNTLSPTPVVTPGDEGVHVTGGWDLTATDTPVSTQYTYNSQLIPLDEFTGYTTNQAVLLYVSQLNNSHTPGGSYTFTTQILGVDDSLVTSTGSFTAADWSNGLLTIDVTAPPSATWEVPFSNYFGLLQGLTVNFDSGISPGDSFNLDLPFDSGVSAVPEPSTLALLGIAAAAVGGFALRRRQPT